jgi:hypothetical protein
MQQINEIIDCTANVIGTHRVYGTLKQKTAYCFMPWYKMYIQAVWLHNNL